MICNNRLESLETLKALLKTVTVEMIIVNGFREPFRVTRDANSAAENI